MFWFHPRNLGQMLKINLIMLVFPAVCDYLGERLASLFGITTPKYQYAIDEYYRMKKEVGGHLHLLTSLSFR